MLTPVASSGPYIDTAIPFHFTGSATASAGPGGAYTILTTHAVGEGGTWHIGPLTPGVSQNVVVHTGNGTSIFRAAVTGGSATSASHNIMSGASVNTTLNFIPNTTFVDIEIADNSPFGGTNSIQVFGFTIDTVTYIPQTVVATITSGDDYHYGFNGQMKVNEMAGEGNWNSALYWEYDTRTATRKNRDPKSIPSMSEYAVFKGNPIWMCDPDGDKPWVPVEEDTKDKDGKTVEGHLALKKEEGDNPQTLAQYLNIPLNKANGIYSTITPGGTVRLPDDIPGVAPINAAINDGIVNDDDYHNYHLGTWTSTNYNCWESAVSISQGHAPNMKKIMGLMEFKEAITTGYTDVTNTPAQYKFGQTVIRFADKKWSLMHGSYSVTTHAAVYLGTSRSGIQYTWSKNGFYVKPAILTVPALKKEYGDVEGYGAQPGGGYYNRR